MARPRKNLPTYQCHKPSGRAVVYLRRADGTRYPKYLGPYGSPESHEEYSRLCAEIDAGREIPADDTPPTPVVPHVAIPKRTPPPLTVRQLATKFLAHAEKYYRHPDGTQTGEAEQFRHSLRGLCDLFGDKLARDFTKNDLKEVRNGMVSSALSRKVVNQRVGRIVRMFMWAADPDDGPELIPEDTAARLLIVKKLKPGRSDAPERADIAPVAWEVVEATLTRLDTNNPTVAAMVRLLWHSGMRPGEVCRLTWGEIDATGDVWVYRPVIHKTAYRGKARVVCLGPKCQAILSRWKAPTAYIFPPYGRRKRERYTAGTFYTAVRRACIAAGVPHWHPNQIRHAAATAIRARYGLEAAQVSLGHSRADVTQVYAERDLASAIRVAREIG